MSEISATRVVGNGQQYEDGDDIEKKNKDNSNENNHVSYKKNQTSKIM
jgi:hypothetical protein